MVTRRTMFAAIAIAAGATTYTYGCASRDDGRSAIEADGGRDGGRDGSPESDGGSEWTPDATASTDSGRDRDAGRTHDAGSARDAGPPECTDAPDGTACLHGHCCAGTCVLNVTTATCGSSCVPCEEPVAPHTVATCDGATCGVGCARGYSDCDADATNGCETHRAACAPTSGLVAHYPLDGDATDHGPGGVDGAVYGATAAADRFGTAGGALHFTASASDHVAMADNPMLPTGSAARTVSLWLRADTRASSYAALANWGAASTGRRFGISLHSTACSPCRYAPMFTAQYSDLRSTTLVDDAAWHHVAVTYDGTTVELFIDGVLDMAGPMSLDTVGAALLVSRKVDTTGEAFDGDLDDLRVYDRRLSAEQIGDIFHERGFGE